MIATGWAITIDGRIKVETVSPTRIGALVNWLVVNHKLVVTNNVPDSLFEEAFAAHAEREKAALVQVTITATSG